MADALGSVKNVAPNTEENKPVVDDKALSAAVEAKLKELGIDDTAQKAIHKRNEEAKSHRERAETLEKELNETKAKIAEREAADLERAKAEEAEKAKKENEELTSKQRIEKLEKALDAQHKNFEDMTKAERVKFDATLKARDEALVKEAVRSGAVSRGLITEELVDLLDLDIVTVKDGRINREELKAFLDSLVEEKEAWFKPKTDGEDEETTESRTATGRFERPDSKKGGSDKNVDASKLSKEDFDKLEERLRSKRA
jgi:hypothetical protein